MGALRLSRSLTISTVARKPSAISSTAKRPAARMTSLCPILISTLSIIIISNIVDDGHSAAERMRGEKFQTRIARIAIATHQQALEMGCRIIALHFKERASEPP